MSGVEKAIGVKNLDEATVSKRVEHLCKQLGRKHVQLHAQQRAVFSTQGVWAPDVMHEAAESPLAADVAESLRTRDGEQEK